MSEMYVLHKVATWKPTEVYLIEDFQFSQSPTALCLGWAELMWLQNPWFFRLHFVVKKGRQPKNAFHPHVNIAHREIAPSKDAPHRLAEGCFHRPVGKVDVEHEHTRDQGVTDEGQKHARLSTNLY